MSLPIQDAAAALRQQYTDAGILGDGMVLTVSTGVTPPPAGPKLQVIDVTIADGYTPPAESASGYTYAGNSVHYRVRTWSQVSGSPGRTLLSLSS